MSPFKDHYGRRCNTPISWDDRIKKVTLKHYLLKDIKHEVRSIGKKLKVAQDKQKSYVDRQRMHTLGEI